ncbi:MAG: MarR family transcriptional regulator [Thermoplasmata archaeon]|jgi:MarR family 2-MHQ and catechol resistance regulon transcriptional repressor
MTVSDRKKLEDIADDFMDLLPTFFRRISREEARPGARKFDPSHFVLRAALKHGPIRMSEIGRHIGVSKPYMTALVNKLISEGLVERVPDPGDRRVVNVRITDAGRDAVKQLTRRTRETVIKNLSSLDPEDISTLHELMKNIRGIVSKLEQDETSKCRIDRM